MAETLTLPKDNKLVNTKCPFKIIYLKFKKKLFLLNKTNLPCATRLEQLTG